MNHDLSTNLSLVNLLDNFFNKKMLNINTMLICEVIEVLDNSLHVKPMFFDVMSDGTREEPPILYNIPIMQYMGANSGVFIEIAKGDIGIVSFCQRDISGVISSKDRKNPNTKRKFSLSDGVWMGSILKNRDDFDNKIEFINNDIVLTSKDSIELDSKTVSINSKEKTTIQAGGSDLGTLLTDVVGVINGILTAAIQTPDGPATPIGTTYPDLGFELARIKQELSNFK